MSTPCSATLSQTNEMTNCVQPSLSQESGSPHEPIFVNVHENSAGHAPISLIQTMVQDNPIEHRLTSVAQASTSDRCKADPARLKEDPASAMKTKFGVDIDNSILYQKPYPAEFDLVSFPAGWCVPDFVKFSGDDNRAPWEHIDQYILQLGKAGFHEALCIRLFSLSLTGTTFSWFSSLAPNSIQSWNQLERKFHDRFYNGHNEAKLSDLASVRQGQDEPASDYFRRFKDIKNRCLNLTVSEKELADLAFDGLRYYLKKELEGFEYHTVNYLHMKVLGLEFRLQSAKDVHNTHWSIHVDCKSDSDDEKKEVAEFIWPSEAKPCSVGIWGSKNKNFLPHKPGLLQL